MAIPEQPSRAKIKRQRHLAAQPSPPGIFKISLFQMFYEKHVLFGLNQIYYWVLKCTTCYHYTNIIKSILINLIKIGNIFTTEKGLA
jgi:hypothetical protein